MDRNDRKARDLLAAEKLAFRPSDAAGILGISRSTVYELIATGEIAAIRVGRAILIRRDELERWLDRKAGSPESAAGRML